MKVATTAKTGTTNTIKVTNGPLGGFGTATSGSLSIT